MVLFPYCSAVFSIMSKVFNKKKNEKENIVLG